MKKLNISLIIVLLISGILLIYGCKNRTEIRQNNVATKSLIETKSINYIREVPINKEEKKKPSIFLFLFNRKEYYKQLNADNDIKETDLREKTNKNKNIEIIATKSTISYINKTNNIKNIVATISKINETEKETSIINEKEFEITKNKETIEATTINKENYETIEIIEEENNNIEYIDKVFTIKKDNLNIKVLIKDLNDRNYNKVYEDFLAGKYENTIKNFINNYDGIFNDIKVEINKDKYKEFNKNIVKELNDIKYNKIKKEIEKALNKHKSETKEIENFIKRLNFKTLLINLNKGKYITIINEIKEVLFNNEYNNIRENLINEFIDGEYTEITYDFVYNLLEITYKYKIDVIEETKEIETIEEIIEEVVNEKEKGLPIIPIAIFLIIAIIGLIIAYIKMNKRSE